MKRKAAVLPSSIGDLIEVPPIRQVIQLVDVERPELRDELVENFVFTEEVTRLFERLITALEQPHGVGAFLKGHYGSGKSHCLAFLHQLLQGHPAARGRLPEELASRPLPQGWIQVSVPLFAFPAEQTLERIVMGALEDQLAAELPDAPVLAESTRLLERFRTYVLPQHRDELPGFEKLEPAAAARRAREFLRRLPDNPLQIPYDRRQAMQTLQAGLGESRVILLLDELSEFLRSKENDPAALREDIRFLQFLGEWCDKLGLWVLATLQHSLEELGYLEETTQLRLRERYPLRFTLSSRHVADLVGGRLIRHRAGSEPVLRQLWQELERLYPGLVGESEFLRTYPLHPLTLQLLENLIGQFSRHRGVVDFVHTQLAGDPLRGQPGILHEPPDRLLTAETLFDHFRERFSEQAELAPYEASVWAYYQQELPVLFPSERERELAAAVVKLLILAAISPVPVETSAERLSLLLARRLSRLDPHSNLAYLQERVLQPLLNRAAFVVRRGTQYAIDLQANANQILGERVRARMQEVQPDWAAALALVNRPNLPLAEGAGRPAQSARIRWRNAAREGLWALLLEADRSTLLTWVAQLDAGKEDWALVLLSPGLPAAEQESLVAAVASVPNLVLWRPAEPESEMLEAMLQWQAHEAVLAQDRQLRTRLESVLVPLRARLQSWVFGLYARGELQWAGQVSSPPLHESRWEKLLLACVATGLEQRFPQFGSVAPRLEALSSGNVELLWEKLLEPGMCPAGDVRVDSLVDGVLKPLGLVEQEDEQWRVALSGGPGTAMLARMQAETRYNLQELRRTWQKSSWGLVPGQFYLLLAALVQLGKVQLYAHGRAWSLTQMGELMRGKADEVQLQPLRTLPPLEELEKLRFLWGDQPLVPLNPTRVRELWRVARERLNDWGARNEALRLQLSRLDGPHPVPPELGELAGEFARKLNALGAPHSAAQGLGQLVVHEFSQLGDVLPKLLTWADFLRDHGTRWAQQLGLMQSLGIDTSPLATAEQPEPLWRELQARFESMSAAEREQYLAAHTRYYEAEPFSEKRAGQNSLEWKALGTLCQVLGFQPRPGHAQLRQELDSLPVPCRRQPVAGECLCGFRPGQPVPAPSGWSERVRQALRSGSSELLRQQRALGKYLQSLHGLGREREVRRLESVLNWLEQEPTESVCASLLEVLDRSTVDHLSRALTGQTLVTERDLRELTEALADQRLPVAEVRRRFEEWLQSASLPAESWIHVAAGADVGGSAGPWLRLWLQQHALEAPSAWLRRFDLDGEPQGEFPEEELLPYLREVAASLSPEAGARQEALSATLSLEFCQKLWSGGGAGRGWTLPAAEWPHLRMYRELSRLAAAQGFAELAGAWRDWQRLQYEDPGGLLSDDVRSYWDSEFQSRLSEVEVECVPLRDAPAVLAAAVSDSLPWIILVLDGLRWDLWDLLRPEFERRLGTPSLERVACAELPTVTAQARRSWLAGPEEIPAGADGFLLGRPLRLIKSAESKRQRATVLEQLLEPAPATMLHFNFIDKRRHTSELELWPLYRELLAECEVRVFPLLGMLPRLAQVMLLSDHGFLDPGTEGPPHGGGHWQEKYVPAVAWRR